MRVIIWLRTGVNALVAFNLILYEFVPVFRKTTKNAHHKNIVDAAALDDNLLEKISGGVDMGTTAIDVTSKAGAY